MTKNALSVIFLTAVCALLFAGCVMPRGDATLSSRGDGLHLGGNLGIQLGGGESNGGGSGPAH